MENNQEYTYDDAPYVEAPIEQEEHQPQQDTAEIPVSESANETAPAYEEGAEESQEAAAPPQQKPHLRDKFAEVNRANYRYQQENSHLYDENQSLRAEVERLQRLADSSTETALSHYEKASQERLERAKERKQKAYQEGTIEEQTEADIALINAAHERQNLLNMKARSEVLRQEQAPPPVQPTYASPQIEAQRTQELHRWVAHNPWMNPQDASYNPQMANAVAEYARQYEQNLYDARLESQIGSPAYFNTLNQYVDRLVYAGNRNQHYPKEPNMQRPHTPVGTVRNGAIPLRNAPKGDRPNLTPEQREVARMIGMADKDYEAYVRDDENRQRFKEANKHKGVINYNSQVGGR